MRTRNEASGAMRLGAGVGLLLAGAALLSGCAIAPANPPSISQAQVQSGDRLPVGLLPNGIYYEPYDH